MMIGRRQSLPIAVVALALSSCGGGDGSDCRESADCRAPLECLGPSEPNVCGIPPLKSCATGNDCGPDLVCHAVADACTPDGVGSQCGPVCVAGQCDPGFRCNAAGECEAVPCDEGYACAVYQECDPSIPNGTGPIYDRAQGCVAISCTGDGDCPNATSCVNSICQAGPGSCQEVQIVP